MQSSSHSAEYGRQPGAQVQLTPKSGGNAFHGSGFDYLRNDAFNAQFTTRTTTAATRVRSARVSRILAAHFLLTPPMKVSTPMHAMHQPRRRLAKTAEALSTLRVDLSRITAA